MSDSTPLPWALHSKASFARIVRADSAGRGGGVAQFVHTADAELACRAVNALGPLVAGMEIAQRKLECLRPFIEFKSSPTGGPDDAVANYEFILATFREALRLAGKT